ncbi:hypothetical protein NQ318_003790 [Aromia moschata]|uniref:Uncharacterized protein n=1 Tax=Aromia moschata TaxID=1265417 RepID=A0AAV8YH58_9CUCU|nr:hypothetical protein NQ318_003790 [Aromia moschata]
MGYGSKVNVASGLKLFEKFVRPWRAFDKVSMYHMPMPTKLYCFVAFLPVVGLKPAGESELLKTALSWLILIKELLGNEWLTPELFRFGASGLLGDLECSLYECVKESIQLHMNFPGVGGLRRF